jgi:hypothetical protein
MPFHFTEHETFIYSSLLDSSPLSPSKPLYHQNLNVTQYLASLLLPYSPLLLTAVSSSATASVTPVCTDLNPQVIAVINDTASLELLAVPDSQLTVVDAWNNAFSAIILGGVAVLVALLVHAG